MNTTNRVVRRSKTASLFESVVSHGVLQPILHHLRPVPVRNQLRVVPVLLGRGDEVDGAQEVDGGEGGAADEVVWGGGRGGIGVEGVDVEGMEVHLRNGLVWETQCGGNAKLLKRPAHQLHLIGQSFISNVRQDVVGRLHLVVVRGEEGCVLEDEEGGGVFLGLVEEFCDFS